MLIKSDRLDASDVARAAAFVSDTLYDGNVVIDALTPGPTDSKGRHATRFTLRTRNGRAYGSRTTSTGVHMPYASWEAHRDVLRELFSRDPDAYVKSGLAVYKGADDFEQKHGHTAYTNVGSQARPVYMRDLSVPR